ncbi:MAG TPA: phosphorylase [Methyloceanibacter sp.]|nr:phosphorylase [Methyloceanibacter sp.]
MGNRGPGFVIAATGLRAEARIAADVPNVRAVASGGDTGRLETLIRWEIGEGGRAILSFGVAAGLAPGKTAGTCFIASAVVHSGKTYAADRVWAGRLQAALPAAELAVIAGVDRPLVSPAEKSALHAATGAAAADMESYIAARIAAEHRLPFAALRAIADPAEEAVPGAALAGMRADGRVDVWAVFAALMRSPGELPSLLRLAREMQMAMAALFRCYRSVGPGFSLGDLV